MIASLGMYDFGDASPVNDRFWALIRDHLRQVGQDAPDALTRGDAAYWPAWESPDLVLSQTCGYPYRTRLHDRVTYVATPDFGIEGCPPGHYRSLFIARSGDPRRTLAELDGAAFAFNDDLSQSGWAAPQVHAHRLGLTLRPVLRSGGHRLSALAVADARADLAAVDAVTWQLMLRNDPDLGASLKVVGHTDPTPGLPYIAAMGVDATTVLTALQSALAVLPAADRETLGLCGFVRIAAPAYLAVPNPPSPAQYGLHT